MGGADKLDVPLTTCANIVKQVELAYVEGPNGSPGWKKCTIGGSSIPRRHRVNAPTRPPYLVSRENKEKYPHKDGITSQHL